MLIFFKSVFFLGGVVPLFLGLFIYLKNRKELLTRTYFRMSTCCAIWSLGFFMLISSETLAEASFWRWFMESGSIFIAAFWLHFVCIFSNIDKEKKKQISFVYLISFFLWLINLSDLFGTKWFATQMIRKDIFNFYPTAGIGYSLYFLFFFLVALYSFFLLFQNLKKGNDLIAAQSKYLIAATILGFGGGGMTFLLTFNVPVTPYGVIFFTAYPVAIAYTVTKYHLFNIKVITTQLLVSALSIFVFVRTIIAENGQEQIINGILFIVITIVGIFLIRSVIKEVEQREHIEKLAKELEVVNAGQESLLHFISHEVKGYFTKVSWTLSELMEGEYGTVPEEMKTPAKEALESIKDGVDTVEGILKASNMKKGSVKYDMQPFDFKSVVVRLVDKLKMDAEKKGLNIETDIEEGQDFTVTGDVEHISKHVLRNLVDNAIKYTPKGDVKINLSKKDAKVLFSVKDSGVGITPEDKARLFTEGGRGKDSVKVNVHSTGYGLYIAKQIVDAHKGRIWVESEGADKGSTFFVEL